MIDSWPTFTYIKHDTDLLTLMVIAVMDDLEGA